MCWPQKSKGRRKSPSLTGSYEKGFFCQHTQITHKNKRSFDVELARRYASHSTLVLNAVEAQGAGPHPGRDQAPGGGWTPPPRSPPKNTAHPAEMTDKVCGPQ